MLYLSTIIHSCYNKAEFSAAISPVFNVTWSFRNHANSLIKSSKVYYYQCFKKKLYLCFSYSDRESSMRCNFRKHIQIEKAPPNQENIFISLTAGAANKEFSLQRVSFFWLCCEHLQLACCQIVEVVFLICRCFFYLQHVELSRPSFSGFFKIVWWL